MSADHGHGPKPPNWRLRIVLILCVVSVVIQFTECHAKVKRRGVPPTHYTQVTAKPAGT